MPDEHLSNEQLIREKYRGIRPAPGYPACPDHSLKPLLFDLLGEAPAGIELTENFAMLPTSAVSGFYFAHPRQPAISAWRGSARTSSRIMPSGAGSMSRRRRAGCGPISTSRRDGRLALACRCFAGCSSCCSAALLRPRPPLAQLAPRENAIQPELVAEGPAVPGGEVELAILMHTKPGWHGYWLNPGDAGLPMKIEWQLPQGRERRAAALSGAGPADGRRAS